jgi:YegS/Rv2252/BmrU family lipid kinase
MHLPLALLEYLQMGGIVNLDQISIGTALDTETDRPSWYVIVNPASGLARRFAQPGQIEESLTALGIVFELHRTSQSGDAQQLAHGAFACGWRDFVVAGGDGTAHEVVNGIMVARGFSQETFTLALLPLGTGNDWARSLRVPKRLNAACLLLTTGRPTPCDVGKVEYGERDQRKTRYFVNMAGVGFDGHVVRHLQYRAPGRLQYLLGLIRSSRSFRAPEMAIRADNWSHSGRTLAVFVCIGCFLGGGMRIAPQAKIDDGLFEVTIVENMSGMQILMQIPRLFLGSLAASKQVQLVQATHVSLTGDADIQADGELLGKPAASFEVISGALNVMMDPRRRST